MRPEIYGDFEIHLTTHPDADLAATAARHAMKVTHIQLDRGEHPGQPMLTYQTLGFDSDVVAEAQTIAGRLAGEGLPVVRIKVEVHAANPGVPQTDEEDPDGYFECHLRVLVDGRLAELRELAAGQGARLSRNPVQISGPQRHFVTGRAHSVPAAAALDGFDRLQTAVEAAGFTIDKAEREYVLFDTYLELDRGW